MFYFQIIEGVIYKFRTSDDELISAYDTLGEFLRIHYRSKEVTRKQINEIAWQWVNGKVPLSTNKKDQA